LGRPNRKDKKVVPDYSEGLQSKIDDSDPRFNNALARGLAILQAFQLDDKLLSNLEIAERTGIPKSTVSRLTFTLTKLGYLLYRETYGMYELAAGVVGLAYPYLANQAVPAIARPFMLELARDTRTNVGLGIQEGLSALFLEYALGEANPARRQRVGFRVPLARTAMGFACVAGMDDHERQRIFEELKQHYPREWPKLKKQFEDAVHQVRSHGYCIAVGTFNSMTNTVAVPFVYDDSRKFMAINSQGLASLQTPEAMAATGKRLVELAEKIRLKLAAPSHMVD
jgi:DNA-binding IclR family transcriptional regulator